MAGGKDSDKEYKGPGRFTGALGRSATESVLVGGIATVVGIGAGALLKMKFAPRQIRVALDDKAPKLLSISERVVGAVVGGTVLGTLGTLGGGLHGAYRGMANVDAAEKQVHRLSSDLRVSEEKFELQKSYLKKLTSPDAVADKTDPNTTPSR